MHGLHQTVVIVQRHNNSIFRITSSDYGYIRVVNYRIQNGLQAVRLPCSVTSTGSLNKRRSAGSLVA